jgi:hypothetical protein
MVSSFGESVPKLARPPRDQSCHDGEVVKCQRAAAVRSAAAAIGPTARDFHSPQPVLTLIDAKPAEPFV